MPTVLPRSVTAKYLWENRRALAGWAVGTALVAMMYSSFFPQMSGSGSAMKDFYDKFPKSMREAFNLDDLSNAAGYLASSPMGLIVPLLVLFYGASTGARAIAGDEENGYLDLLLAHPLSRTRLLLQRVAALAAGSFTIAFLVFLALLAVRSSAELTTISVGEFAAQCLNLALLGVVFGALAVCLGGITGKRGLVFGVTAAVGVLAYAAKSFASQIGMGWAEKLSPFSYYIGGEPLKHGFLWDDAGILAGIAAVLVAIGVYRFNRRDISV